MRVVYIHGFNSGPSSASIAKLRQCFADVTPLTYDSADAFPDIYARLKAGLESLPAGFLLVGSSLGGYYTALLANDLNLPAVIANPCNDPRQSLEQFLGANVSFDDGHPWNFTRQALESYAPLDPAAMRVPPRLVIIGRRDSLLDPVANEAFWRPHAPVILTDDEHSLASFMPLQEKMLAAFERFAQPAS